MNFLRYFPFVVASVLLTLAGVFHSAAFAAASVITLLVIATRDSVSDYMQIRTIKSTIPDEAKKKIQELESRITSVEVGISRRGF